jgi:hypothetical protein
LAEERWAGGEGLQCSIAEAGVAVEEEQEPGHALREGEDVGVARFVEFKAATGDGSGEEEGLAEGQGEAFSGDGVDGAGGVPKKRNIAEGDVVARDMAEAAGEGEAAAFRGGGWRITEFVPKEWDGVEEFRQADAGVTGHNGDADFFRARRGDVDLA